MARHFRAASSNAEVRTSSAVRDLRPLWKQVFDAWLDRRWAAFTFVMFAGFILIWPSLADVFLFFTLLIFWYSFWSMKTLPFKMPIFAKKLDKNNPIPGTDKPGPSQGIYFFGNELNTNAQMWFSNSDMRTHVLIFGSTGSGKTEALLSISYNAILQGSGFIYVDGKGDNSLFAKIFSMVRSLGREDDLLAVNFMTGAADIIGPQEHVLSNTMNPFAVGSSSMLSNLVVSLMDSGGGTSQGGGSDSDMWKGRAIAFIDSLMRPLVWLRDNGYLLLDASTIRRYFSLDVLEDLVYDRKVVDQKGDVTVIDRPLPFEVRDSLDNYFATLPGYQKSEKGKQSGKAYEQHGYITMQLTRIFGSLADVYGHIVRAKLAEVDFKDVVLNRRILVVLLPALEKSPDELSNLGKLVIASLRAMLASGLGDKLEGDYADVIETKPTNSSTPFLCILDEYGYYAVKGFAVVPAQARSLGFSVVFAGQDLPAFQKASKEEAASITANTNIKICMKLEDPVETWDFFQKTAGESYVSVAKSFNVKADSIDVSYRDTQEAQLDKRARIDLLDLKDQREGEAHVFFRSRIVRASMFYANPPKVKRIKLNQMLKVEGPSDQAVKFLTALNGKHFTVQQLDRTGKQEPLLTLFDILNDSGRKENSLAMFEAVSRYIAGHSDEEKVDFGDQSNNPSIFMSVPVDERLSSDFFDVEVSTLQEAMLTKEKLYEVVKRLAILEGRSESHARKEANDV
ncbi:MAG: phosphoesterase, partial [Gammaproteobacteria bacterium]|nr:phosphoesterase [Gammaproteobacteria bacterium]